MNVPAWSFAPTNGGIQGGIADAIQELFDSDHEKFIARETIQNSLDAAYKEDNVVKPVSVTFRRFSIESKRIPDLDKLVEVMRKCREFPPNDQKRAQEFFSKAILLATRSKISVLSVEDSNTVGITGGDEDYKDRWYRLIKSEGVSAQSSAIGGGAFGIGKGAPFAASNLRTVFYSTRTKNGVAFQGVSRLTSYKDDESVVHQRVGFFGVDPGGRSPDSVAIRDVDKIPLPFRRDSLGTNIYILGYEPKSTNWRRKLLIDVLQNFWAAIYEKKLEVNLLEDGQKPITVNKANLEFLIEELQPEFKDEKLNPRHYYRAMVKTENMPIEGRLARIGKVKLYISVEEGGPRAIQWMRSPMILVRTKTYTSTPIKYSGVFVCDDEKGNLKLRDMEPAEHNDWLPSKIEEGAAIIGEINNWTNEQLRDLVPDQDEEELQIPELGELLPDEDDLPVMSGEDSITKEGEEQPKEEETDTKKNEATVKKTVAIFKAAPGDKKRRIHIGKKRIKKRGKPEEPTVDPNDEGAENMIDTTNLSIRNYIDDSGNYHLIVRSDDDVNGSIILRAVGEEGNFVLPILSAVDESTQGELSLHGSRIDDLSIRRNGQVRLKMIIKGNRRYKLSLKEHIGE